MPCHARSAACLPTAFAAVLLPAVLCAVATNSAIAESTPWNWIDSEEPPDAASGNAFSGGDLSLVDGTVVFTAASSFQRNLFWDFENPHPEDPVFSGQYDPEFADYHYPNDTLHDGCDWYLLDDFVVLDAGANGGNATQVMQINTGEIEWWHLNNLDNDNPIKYVWFQFDYYSGQDFLAPVETIKLGDRDGYKSQILGWANNAATENAWGTFGMLWSVAPNPDWEEIGIQNSAPGPFYVDNFHVVTVCVPSPSNLVGLLGIGVIGILGRGWRCLRRLAR